LSDKLLKAVQRGFRSPLRGGVYYAFLFQSQPVISGFFSSTDRVVCEVIHIRRVDGGAL
jgi:hypothetical protein